MDFVAPWRGHSSCLGLDTLRSLRTDEGSCSGTPSIRLRRAEAATGRSTARDHEVSSISLFAQLSDVWGSGDLRSLRMRPQSVTTSSCWGRATAHRGLPGPPQRIVGARAQPLLRRRMGTCRLRSTVLEGVQLDPGEPRTLSGRLLDRRRSPHRCRPTVGSPTLHSWHLPPSREWFRRGMNGAPPNATLPHMTRSDAGGPPPKRPCAIGAKHMTEHRPISGRNLHRPARFL